MTSYNKFPIITVISGIWLPCFSCHQPDDTIYNLTDGLIIPTKGLIHIDLSENLTESVKINFRILKGTQIISITPQISYFNRDSILSDSPINYPDIKINGLNYFHNIDTLVKLNQLAFINIYYRINGGLASFNQGDQWIIGFMVKMNDGRYLRNRFETAVTWDNYFSGRYNDHFIYHKQGYGTYPNDICIDSSFTRELIAIDKLNSVMDFALWGNSGVKMSLFPWATDTITITVTGWKYQVYNGDPNDQSLINHIEWGSNNINKINLYYCFKDSTGNNNILWETLTPE